MIREFVNLLFPQWCAGCEGVLVSGEEWLCTICRSELKISSSYKEFPNSVSSKFYGKVPIEHAFSMFNFSRGGVIQKLLHRLKYNGYYELGVWLGCLLGNELLAERWINEIDMIVPIPLHRQRLQSRGYNQSESFAKGLSQVLIKPVDEVLLRKRNTLSQTRKSRLERWENVATIFRPREGINLHRKNILLVDDVITSGATLEAAAQTLKVAGADKLYISTIASA